MLFSPEGEPRDWDALMEWLNRLARALAPDSQPVALADEGLEDAHSLDAIVQDLRAAEQPHCEAIERAIESLSLGDPTPARDLEGQAAGFLRLRVETAENLAMIQRTVGFEPIEFPDMPFARFVRWLLGEWWEEHGRNMAVSEACAMRWYDA